MLTAMRRAALIGVMAPVALSGCALGGSDKRGPAPGAANQVAAVVRSLERASQTRDFRTVCDRLFTPAARRRAGGTDCARLLRSTAQDLQRPTIQVLGIELSGDRAKVRVRSRAVGQPPLTDTINLVRVGAKYRIEALSD
jgi:hypothetical protein